jgi:hypothetical protein
MHTSARTVCARWRLIRPRVVVLCTAFALGGGSRNVCPAGFSRLGTADACQSAAGVGGVVFGGSGAYAYYPAGCYWHTITDLVYFNAHATGAASYYAKTLCAGAARKPAWPKQVARMHVRAAVCAGVWFLSIVCASECPGVSVSVCVRACVRA